MFIAIIKRRQMGIKGRKEIRRVQEEKGNNIRQLFFVKCKFLTYF